MCIDGVHVPHSTALLQMQNAIGKQASDHLSVLLLHHGQNHQPRVGLLPSTLVRHGHWHDHMLLSSTLLLLLQLPQKPSLLLLQQDVQ